MLLFAARINQNRLHVNETRSDVDPTYFCELCANSVRTFAFPSCGTMKGFTVIHIKWQTNFNPLLFKCQISAPDSTAMYLTLITNIVY